MLARRCPSRRPAPIPMQSIRMDGTGPQSLTGAEIVGALTAGSRIWILTTTGREIQADLAEVGA